MKKVTEEQKKDLESAYRLARQYLGESQLTVHWLTGALSVPSQNKSFIESKLKQAKLKVRVWGR